MEMNIRSVGYLLFVFATLLIFNSDRQYKKGKIRDIKGLFKMKLIGTVILILSVVVMIIGKK